MNDYQNLKSPAAYQEFLSSQNGKISKEILAAAILKRLAGRQQLNILDAGCGLGWLAFELHKAGHQAFGCDASEALIDQARELYPEINFQTADLAKSLPYEKNFFDAIVLNMVAHDLEDQPASFARLAEVLKSQGKLIATMANPYYGYPVGVWKRGWLGFLLRKKPRLKLALAYNQLRAKKDKSYVWNQIGRSRFYPLSEQLNNFLQAGFNLSYFEDLNVIQDSTQFNLEYQLHRFPIILLMEFTKR